MPRSYRLETANETRARVSNLMWGAIWRSAAWLTVLGALLGGVFGAVALLFLGATEALLGLLVGALLGGSLGVAEAMIMAAQLVSALTRTPFTDPALYRGLVRRAGIVAVITAYLAASIVTAILLGTDNIGGIFAFLVGYCIPALVNLGAVLWVALQVSNWMFSSVIGKPEVAPAIAPSPPRSSEGPRQPASSKVYRSSRRR